MSLRAAPWHPFAHATARRPLKPPSLLVTRVTHHAPSHTRTLRPRRPTMLLELVLRGGMPAKAAKKATKKPKKSGNNPKAGTKKAPKKAPKKKVAITAAPGATGGIAKKKGPISTKKKVGKKAVKVKKAIGTGKKAGKK